MIVSIATTGHKQRVILIVDVSRAYMYARIPEDEFMYVSMPDEAGDDGSHCWRLKGAMYGTRKAAQYWQTDASNTLQSCGFKPGKASPVTFYNESRDMSAIMHGDDFVVAAERKDAEWLVSAMSKKYSIKTTMIGGDPDLAKDARILNRMLKWHDGIGVSYEADPRHVEAIVRDTGVENMQTLTCPAVKETRTESEEDRREDIFRKKEAGKLGGKIKKRDSEENEDQENYVYGYDGSE